MLTRNDLHGYQERAVDWMNSNERGFVWLGMGDGKTAIAAHAILDHLTKYPGEKALVIGTKRIIENVWPVELTKWSELSSLSYSAATGPKRKREKALAANPDVLGVSYENLRWLIATRDTEKRSFWIYDEVSKMKSPSTARFRAVARVSTKKPDRAFGLTATPTMEGHGGLFAQWKSVAGDDRLGRNITEFRQLFTRPVFKGQYTDYVIDENAQRKIESQICDSIFTIDDTERPYTGEPQVIDVPIPWGARGARDHYIRMEKELVALLSGGTFLAAANRGVAMSKCRQIATGFIYDEEKNAHALDTEKFDAIQEAYEELQGDPVLVFYQFEFERDELLRRLPGSQPFGDNYDAFTRGEIPALVLHPLSCSHGLNLQNARYVFWSSLPASGEQYVQANARVDRQGQARQPVIKRFLREGSIDEWSVDLLEGKYRDDAALVERIRKGRE